jgi:hypothetical protein
MAIAAVFLTNTVAIAAVFLTAVLLASVAFSVHRFFGNGPSALTA